MQQASDQSTSTAKRQQAFAWLVLIALILLQLANVVHQSSHAAADLTETCVACVQFDAPALVASADGSPGPELGPASVGSKLVQPHVRQAPRTRPPPRASPRA